MAAVEFAVVAAVESEIEVVVEVENYYYYYYFQVLLANLTVVNK